MKSVRFQLDQSLELLTAHSGLALIGLLLSHTQMAKRLVRCSLPGAMQPNVSHSDVMVAYLGLLCQGKSDFDQIESFRADRFFAKSLGIKQIPSSPTLRQRLDLAAASSYEWQTILLEESADLLRALNVPLTPVQTTDRLGETQSWLPLDLDVSPFDNSNTKKEGVSLTYKKVNGYAPFFAYLGQEGYGVNVNLREGSTHVQKEADAFLSHSLDYARRVTDLPLLVRMDAGNDAMENLNLCLDENVDFIVKRNLRREAPEEWLMIARQDGMCCEEREGKRVYLGAMTWTDKKLKRPIRAVY
ncbi:IS1380 family transposase, partial [Paenibacillus periandrae]|uniref:IS1380 family transposase n=1 Tax=Paenibacillus periandrae TaxID=1761741 RepID=UPI001F0A0209